MWQTNELGLASFQQGAVRLDVDARGGAFGIHLKTSGNPMQASSSLRAEPVSATLRCVRDDVLPSIEDQFIRGDEWHVHLPQQSGSYSLDIVFRPVILNEAARAPGILAPGTLVLEATLSIHTSLLDTHPTIDLCVDTKICGRMDAEGDNVAARVIQASTGTGSSGCAAITHGTSASVLLGQHDYPFTTDHSSASEISLRLFGEFLEKGVIRKARPWIVLGSVTEKQLAGLWPPFAGTPLPLTA